MKIRKLLRQRGLGLNLIAGFCFLMLAVYGWGLRWSDLGAYLLAIVLLLGGLIAIAALCGFLLRKLMARGNKVIEAEVNNASNANTSNPEENDKKS